MNISSLQKLAALNLTTEQMAGVTEVLAAGGTSDPNNLVAACDKCNSSKRDRPVSEWEATRCQ